MRKPCLLSHWDFAYKLVFTKPPLNEGKYLLLDSFADECVKMSVVVTCAVRRTQFHVFVQRRLVVHPESIRRPLNVFRSALFVFISRNQQRGHTTHW